MISCLRLKIVILLIIFAALTGGTSCSQIHSDIVQLGPLPERICRVAVVPFVNKTGYRDGNVLFYRVFVSELARFGEFELVPEGDIRRAFRQVSLSPGLKQPTYDQSQIIGDYLKADILLGGIILQMEEASLEGETIPFITVKFDILDAETGQTIWSIYHIADGEQYRKVMHFGVITTITQLAKQMSKEIMAEWVSEGFKGKCIE